MYWAACEGQMSDLMSYWPGNQLQTCFVLNYSLEVQLGRQKFPQVPPNLEEQPARKELYSFFFCFFLHYISVELKVEHGKGHSGFKVIHIFLKLFVFYLFSPFILYHRLFIIYTLHPPPPPHPHILQIWRYHSQDLRIKLQEKMEKGKI